METVKILGGDVCYFLCIEVRKMIILIHMVTKCLHTQTQVNLTPNSK
jgi:hypothetical protein